MHPKDQSMLIVEMLIKRGEIVHMRRFVRGIMKPNGKYDPPIEWIIDQYEKLDCSAYCRIALAHKFYLGLQMKRMTIALNLKHNTIDLDRGKMVAPWQHYPNGLLPLEALFGMKNSHSKLSLYFFDKTV